MNNLPDNTHRFKKRNYRHKISGQDIFCEETDLKWIQEQLSVIHNYEERDRLIQSYCRTFVEAYKAEQNEAAKEGSARNAANTRLREYCEKVKRDRNHRQYYNRRNFQCTRGL